jgi:hypothetical protein
MAPASRRASRIAAALLLLAGLAVGCGDARVPGEVLVPRDAVWRYTIDGARVGDDWRAPGYDDGGWASGPGPLGFSADGLGTETPRPMDAEPPHLSTWHRLDFDVEDPAAYAGLVVRYARDDGLELALNGTLIVESNLPVLETGPAGPEVGAPMAISGDDETRVYAVGADPALLRRGRNVLAALVRQERPESSDQRLEVELVGVRPGDPALLLRGPYLQSPTPRSVVVRLETSRVADPVVRFGLPGRPRDREARGDAPARDHAIVLRDLEPGAEIVYEVAVDGRVPADGGPFRLRLPPEAGDARPLRLGVGGVGGPGNDSARAVGDGSAHELAGRPADAWLLPGDYAYPTGAQAEIQEGLFAVYGGMMARIPFFPVLGNHEEKRSDPVAQQGPHFQTFTLPAEGEGGGVASGSEAYYAFDVGPVHVLALDSSDHGRRFEGPMMTWAREDLAAAQGARWRIAYLHHAPISDGTHGTGDGHQMRMRSRVMPSLEAAGVDVVFGGHSHGYERSFLLHGFHTGPEGLEERMILDRGEDGVYTKPGGVAPGTVYVVAGMGSAPGEGGFDHPAMATSVAGVPGAVVVDVEGCRLEVRAIDPEGEAFDRFVLEKGPPCEAP